MTDPIDTRMRTWFLINERLCAFARAVDAKAFDELDAVFDRDAVGIYDGYRGQESCADLIDKMKLYVGADSLCGPTQHNILNLQVELDGDDRARSRAYFYAAHQGARERAGQRWTTWGEYDDSWRLTAAGWRITERRYTTFFDEGPKDIVGRA